MKTIYLSPSNQFANAYYDRSRNEKEVMEKVARLLFDRLSLYDVLPILNPEKGIAERLQEAITLKVDYYLVLHTNAYNHVDGRGCETWYQVGVDNPPLVNQLSREFAIKVNNEISAITTSNPYAGDRGIKQKQLVGGRDYLWELRENNSPAAYCEIEFHDTPIGCAWILSNLGQIADALCRAIVAQMGLTLKYVPPVETFGVGSKVRVKQSAVNYYTGQPIPNWVKENTYTVKQITPTKILLAEIMSWVNVNDIEGYVTPPPVVESAIVVGNIVKINLSAGKYVTGQTIPLWVKLRKHTVGQIIGNRILLKEIQSWVYLADLNKV